VRHSTRPLRALNDSKVSTNTMVDVYKRQPKTFPIEIVRWPAQGWRPIDKNSGNQGGIVEGVFEFCWKGETLYARNNAVGDSYLDVYKRQAL